MIHTVSIAYVEGTDGKLKPWVKPGTLWPHKFIISAVDIDTVRNIILTFRAKEIGRAYLFITRHHQP